MVKHVWMLCFTLSLLLAGIAQAQSIDWRQVPLQVDEYELTADIAATAQERGQGLMYRETLSDDEGMLFIFERPDRHCFWMRNTLIPLSIAFLDAQGRILQINDMEPESEQLHCATRPASFALEVNQGWFAERDIRPGMTSMVRADRPLEELASTP
ncbi:MAG: DUF192 domain-containing protein [Saccharospirillum sp.]